MSLTNRLARHNFGDGNFSKGGVAKNSFAGAAYVTMYIVK